MSQIITISTESVNMREGETRSFSNNVRIAPLSNVSMVSGAIRPSMDLEVDLGTVASISQHSIGYQISHVSLLDYVIQGSASLLLETVWSNGDVLFSPFTVHIQ